MKRIAVFGIVYGAILLIAFTYKEPILLWLHEEQHNYVRLPWVILFSLFNHTIPVIPISIFSGLMGIKYGVVLGAFINWVGSLGGAVVFFFLARRYFREYFQKTLMKYKHAEKIDQLISEHAFFAVLFSRMIPIIPAQVIHLSSGLSSMMFVHYFIATAVGQTPTMIMYAYLGKQLLLSMSGFLTSILIYIGVILLMFFLSLTQLKKA